jgi:HAL2 family 3'(2'),5'-bisphosphate nucleotidase
MLIDGKPHLSVLGCPNLDLDRALESSSSPSKVSNLSKITPPFKVIQDTNDTSSELATFSPSSGSIYYAVTNQGAYAKSLGMPEDAGYEVQVQVSNSLEDSILCESVEASHGSRDITSKVQEKLQLKYPYLRLDGQCKYAMVGCGAAQGNMRLPPDGYREKIWDHAPGCHFVTEAGGTVTDLRGHQLDFSQGRFLPEEVTGVIASNGKIHHSVVDAVNEVKRYMIDNGLTKKRIFGVRGVTDSVKK